MPNRYDPNIRSNRQQNAPQTGKRAEREKEREDSFVENKSKKRGSSESEGIAKGIRKWILYIFGAEYLRKIDFRKNIPFILMIVAMVIFLVYMNLLTLSRQKTLENLDKERIELNDKYTRIMEKREVLNIDTSQRTALLEVFKEKGFVDDSSLVYDIYKEGKETRK